MSETTIKSVEYRGHELCLIRHDFYTDHGDEVNKYWKVVRPDGQIVVERRFPNIEETKKCVDDLLESE